MDKSGNNLKKIELNRERETHLSKVSKRLLLTYLLVRLRALCQLYTRVRCHNLLKYKEVKTASHVTPKQFYNISFIFL